MLENEAGAAESGDGDLAENQPDPAMEEETDLGGVDAPAPLPPTPSKRSEKEDWLSLTSADDQLWAVSASGTVLNWEKSAWPLDESNFAHTRLSEVALTDVWADSSTDIWIVSEGGEIFHGDGNSWEQQEVANWDNRQQLNSVWGSSAVDIWAVGDAGTLLHFDGNTWTPLNSGTTAALVHVLGAGTNDVLALGPLTVLHFDGVSWSPFTSNNSDWQLANQWTEFVPAPNNGLALIGYWAVNGYKGGGGGVNSFFYQSGQITQELSVSAKAAWLTPSGRFVTAYSCSGPPCMPGLESVESSDRVAWTTDSEATDLWGDADWIWGVGKNGLLARIETPQ